MASRRMFSKDIIDSDKFYDLPLTSQLLYFHLGLNADDDGFIEPKKVARMAGLKIEDLKPLIDEQLVIPFESGVVVITDWQRHNYIRKDRYTETSFKDEKSLLSQGKNDEYILMSTNGQPMVNQWLPQDRLGKDRLGKDRLGERTPTPGKENKFSSLSDIDDELVEKISEDYQVPVSFVKDVKENLELWCGAKGKKYKDYNLALRNWVKKDRAKFIMEAKKFNGGKGATAIDATNI